MAKGEYSMVKFFKVDEDECEEVALDNEIRSMPSFKFFKGRNVVDELVGANAFIKSNKKTKLCKIMKT